MLGRDCTGAGGRGQVEGNGRRAAAPDLRIIAAPDTAEPTVTAALRAAALLLLLAAGAAAAQAPKVLRYALGTPVSTLDPAAAGDVPTVSMLANIFDTPYTYDYLARPAKLRPNTAEALPEIGDGGRTLTLRIRPGIHFADDPAFKGAKRELTAADYVYSLKRHWDPKIKSPNLYLINTRIKGMAALRKEAEATGRFDYDRGCRGCARWTATRCASNSPNRRPTSPTS